MEHREKLRIARKLRTNKEEKKKVPIFQTRGWGLRKHAIAGKVKRNEEVS